MLFLWRCVYARRARTAAVSRALKLLRARISLTKILYSKTFSKQTISRYNKPTNNATKTKPNDDTISSAPTMAKRRKIKQKRKRKMKRQTTYV